MSITMRRNSDRHSPIKKYDRQYGFSSLLFFLTTIATIPVSANGEISELITSSVTATPSTITVDGVDFQWGTGENLQLDGFFLGNDEYVPNLKTNSVSVQRRDIPGVAIGELCGVFAERLEGTTNKLKPDFPALAGLPGICDMSAMLTSSVINRGTLDTFTNTGSNPNNIERIDYRFDGGISAPSDPTKLPFAGHIIGEKNGNNVIQMAAILAMDESGSPTQFGPLVRVDGTGLCGAGGICYGETSLIHDYTFFKSRSLEPLRDLQEVARTTEPVAFAYLSMETLGIPAGGTYFGVSVFPHDVNATEHDLLDISSFPEDTEEPESRPNDNADIYGGSAFLYIIPSGITGRVFCQADEVSTATRPNVPISLFRDTVADGVLDDQQDQLVAQLPGTTMSGQYAFLGLENGSYFVVVVDRADDEAATIAVVIDSSPVENADIFLNEPCLTEGPTAVDDVVTLQQLSAEIFVLLNDRNSVGIPDAQELRILSVSEPESGSAEVQIQDRMVVYTPSQALRDSATIEIPATDTFTYVIEDDQGLTSEATVRVTIRVGDEGVDRSCIEQGRTDCFFVETEVDGIGRIPAQVCLLLLTFVVIRRYALRATSKGGRS